MINVAFRSHLLNQKRTLHEGITEEQREKITKVKSNRKIKTEKEREEEYVRELHRILFPGETIPTLCIAYVYTMLQLADYLQTGDKKFGSMTTILRPYPPHLTLTKKINSFISTYALLKTRS